jgi:alanine dehydrogenase
MRVGTIRETKNEEYRVGLTPAGVAALAGAGHAVVVEQGAGAGAGYSDEQYLEARAQHLSSTREGVSAGEVLNKVT